MHVKDHSSPQDDGLSYTRFCFLQLIEVRAQVVPDVQPSAPKGKGKDKKSAVGKKAGKELPKEEPSAPVPPLKMFSGMKTREEEDLDAVSLGMSCLLLDKVNLHMPMYNTVLTAMVCHSNYLSRINMSYLFNFLYISTFIYIHILTCGQPPQIGIWYASGVLLKKKKK